MVQCSPERICKIIKYILLKLAYLYVKILGGSLKKKERFRDFHKKSLILSLVAGGPWSPKGVNKRDTPLSRRPMSGGTSLLTI